MPEQSRSMLDQSLFDLLRALQVAHELRSFGVCRTCRFFAPEGDKFRCGLTKEPLEFEQTTKICREHAASAA
jgi:MarR family transcriptional repressor of emrRAB